LFTLQSIGWVSVRIYKHTSISCIYKHISISFAELVGSLGGSELLNFTLNVPGGFNNVLCTVHIKAA